jgi:hypothetical protein
LFFDGKDKKQTVVGVTPVQNVLSRGLGEQQEPIHVLPLKSASWWILLCSSPSSSSFSLPHHSPHSLADIPGMLAGIISLMSLIYKFSHGHQSIPKLTAGFYGIVGVGIITYLLGTIYTLFYLGSPGIVYRISVGVYWYGAWRRLGSWRYL